MKQYDPPEYLAKTEADVWRRLQSEYDLVDGPAFVLLEQLCRNLQLIRECREIVERDGKIGENGKEHVLLKVWRDAEKQATIALKALNFDLEPLQARTGHPAGAINRRA